MTIGTQAFFARFYKSAVLFSALALPFMGISGCSVNPATGQQQFTALMSPAQEASVGATEHEKIMQSYGGEYNSPSVKAYVSSVGQRVAQNTERADVQYKFFVLDTPMVNAFALPGGYVYISRGLLALANDEAELAGVLGHEIGHITGRHSAERYSRSVVSTLGASILSAALDSSLATQALGVGNDLYTKSYSRGQEMQADDLGVRYIANHGYDPMAMADFLRALDATSSLEGGSAQGGISSYFSTHPVTADRVSAAMMHAGNYPTAGKNRNRDQYLAAINGITYGDSAQTGFTRGHTFWHPAMDFTLTVPDGFQISNQPDKLVATGPKGEVVIFDGADNPQRLTPDAYLQLVWLNGDKVSGVENVTVNGRPAATASFPGTLDGKAVTVRVMAVQWSPDRIFRFQIATGNSADSEGLKRMTYSLRNLTAEEKASIKPQSLQIITAGASDSVASLAARMPFADKREERFRVLNGLANGQQIVPGQKYKLVTN